MAGGGALSGEICPRHSHKAYIRKPVLSPNVRAKSNKRIIYKHISCQLVSRQISYLLRKFSWVNITPGSTLTRAGGSMFFIHLASWSEASQLPIYWILKDATGLLSGKKSRGVGDGIPNTQIKMQFVRFWIQATGINETHKVMSNQKPSEVI